MIPELSPPIIVLAICILLIQWRLWHANRRIFSHLSGLSLEDRQRLGVTEQDPRYRASFGLPRQIADNHVQKHTNRRLMLCGLPNEISGSAAARADLVTMRSCWAALLVLAAAFFRLLGAPVAFIAACLCLVMVGFLRPGPWPEAKDRP